MPDPRSKPGFLSALDDAGNTLGDMAARTWDETVGKALPVGRTAQPPAVASLDELPDQISHRALNPKFQSAAGYSGRRGEEVDYTAVLRPDGREALVDKNYGSGSDSNTKIDRPYAAGEFHLHPRVDGKAAGGSLSGRDAGALINSRSASFIIAQDGPQQYMFVKTRETPSKVDGEVPNDENRRRADFLHASMPDMSWVDATDQAARETASRFNLGYYRGQGGVFKRVSLPPPQGARR